MAKVKVKLNSEGVRSLLKSQEMMDICKGYADKALSRLADGYEVTTFVGTNRVNASIKAVTNQAIAENLRDNTILKAVQS